MLYKVGPRAVLYPTMAWLIILTVLFLAEYSVMMAIDILLPVEISHLAGALLDALTVTAVIAPIIWWTLVRPLREVIRLRTRFLGDLFTAIEVERRQTAYELHDGIGQQLSLLISGLRSAHEEIGNPEVATRFRGLEQFAQTALAEVKRIARGLRPSLLDDLGLVAAIEKVVRDYGEHAGVKIMLDAPALVGIRLPDMVETTVFRIFQEALTNAIRHADAHLVRIGLEYETRQITLTASDDGRGFDPESKTESAMDGGHMGLVGIRERVALLGGQFSLDTAPGQGCRIAVTLPTEGKIHE